MKRTIFTIITAACLAITAMAQEQAPASTTTATTANTTIGSIPGTSGVSPTGAATYTIPIAVPAGINGMQPQISINYNSQGGYGALGRGWDVAAGSAITRVPRNEYYNGVNDRIVSYSNTDALMLDGQRLILLSGSNLNEGAVYGFENENYTRVTIVASPNPVPDDEGIYFQLTTKEGNTVIYGLNDDSRIRFEQKNMEDYISTLSWRICQSKNVFGQEISYSYSDQYIDKIKYPGGIISFIYQDNPNIPPAGPINPYVKGRIYMSKLLQNITVAYSADGVNAGATQRTYSFNYTSSTDKLWYIDLKAADGTRSNLTYVNWYSSGQLGKSKIGPVTDSKLSNESSATASINYADVNGDGWNDRIQFWCGNGAEQGSVSVFLYDKDTKKFSANAISISFDGYHNYYTIQPRVELGDINNDGKAEIILIGSNFVRTFTIDSTTNKLSVLNDISTEIYYWDGDISKTIITDTNNDNFSDLVFFRTGGPNTTAPGYFVLLGSIGGLNSPVQTSSNGNTYAYSYFLVGNNISNCMFGDFNGDGSIGINMFSDKSVPEFNMYNINFKYISSYPKPENFEILLPIDYNSDGVTDYLLKDKNDQKCYFWTPSNNSSTFKDSQGYGFAFDNNHIYPIDLDGDGQLDLVTGSGVRDYQKWTFYKNDKGKFTNQGDVEFFDNPLKKISASVSDFDSDGVADLIIAGGDGNFWAISIPSIQKQYLVSNITNGEGFSTSFTYKYFTNYEDGQLTGDIRNLKAPIMIVNQVSEQNGSVTEYDFQKPKVHIKGKGFLGFTEMTVKNSLANRKTVTTSNIISLSGKIYNDQTSQTVTTYDDKPISSSLQKFSIINLSGNQLIVVPYSQTTTDALTGLSSTTAYRDFDNYGNAKTIITTKGNITSTLSTTYKSRITGGPEYLPESVTTTTVENGVSYIRKKTIEYDTNQKGQIIKEITDPLDVNKLTTTYSDFDLWGMPQTITVKGKENGVEVSRSSHKRRTTSGRFIQSETNAIGQYTTYNWDETTGLLSDKTEYLDKKTTYSYDSWGRLITTTDPKTGISVTSSYSKNKDNHGNNISTPGATWHDTAEKDAYYSKLTTTKDKNGKAVSAPVTTWYDEYWRETKRMTYGLDVLQPIYQYTTYDDDKLGGKSLPTFSTEWYNRKTKESYWYDSYGRVEKILTPSGFITYTYDGKKNKVTGTDGMVTITEINDAGQTISVEKYFDKDGSTHKKVNYTYYPSGLVHTTTPDGGATVTMEYDLQGRRTKLTDPDAGETITEYSAFGDITSESRKKGTKTITTRYYYLASGLLDKKQINNDLMQEYKYYYDSNIKGRLRIINKCAQHNRHFYYDDANKNYDRVVKIDETVGVKTYTKSYTYDSYGRQLTETFPTGYATTNHYNDYGILFKITDSKSRTVWQANAENELGQLTSVEKNGISQSFMYDDAGRTTSINATKATPVPGSMPSIDWLVKMEYHYTTEGNLDYRKEFRDGNSQEYQRENFTYDNFNRLTSWAITKAGASTPALTHTITYDPTTGNITKKSDVGSMNMLYDNTSAPHRLTKIDGVPASVSSLTLDISYTDFDKVKKITRASDFPGPNKRKDYDITYGVDDQRITSTYSSGLYKKITTTYLGNYEVEEDSLGNIKKTHYLQGAIYIQTVKADGTTSEQFYSTISDFQGSLIALVDEQGAVKERYAYDPWGTRRNPDDWTQTDTRTSWITHRGYTGHEHIDVFGVIDMNGRVYDPMTAAFFSPDPFVQAPGDWMNYNRYAYCFNNPFRYTDPSGYWAGWDDLVAMLTGGILNVVANASHIYSPWQALGYFIFGALAGEASLYAPGLAPLIYGALSAANSAITQSFNKDGSFNLNQIDGYIVLYDGAMGAVTSWMGGELGKKLGVAGWGFIKEISSPIIKYAVTNIITGVVVGSVFGGVQAVNNAFVTGQELTPEYFWSGVGQGAMGGAVSGTINGLGQATTYSTKNNVNIFTGWPDNQGFVDGTQSTVTLKPGTKISRSGDKFGSFAAPEGTPFEQRSLPESFRNNDLNTYTVVKPFPAIQGTTAPAFEQPGGGTQWKFQNNIDYLLRNGYIK